MRDELDKLIDGALATYSNAEPLAGLEQRVLDRVRIAEASRRRRWRWAAILATPVVAASLLVIFAPKPKPAPGPVAVVATPPAPAPPAVATSTPVQTAARRIVKPRRRAPAPELPKRNLFPTPSAPTVEERLLVELARSSPELLLARPVDEIEIKPIQIAPLRIDGAQ
jgi:hypothetical protein